MVRLDVVVSLRVLVLSVNFFLLEVWAVLLPGKTIVLPMALGLMVHCSFVVLQVRRHELFLRVEKLIFCHAVPYLESRLSVDFGSSLHLITGSEIIRRGVGVVASLVVHLAGLIFIEMGARLFVLGFLLLLVSRYLWGH